MRGRGYLVDANILKLGAGAFEIFLLIIYTVVYIDDIPINFGRVWRVLYIGLGGVLWGGLELVKGGVCAPLCLL